MLPWVLWPCNEAQAWHAEANSLPSLSLQSRYELVPLELEEGREAFPGALAPDLKAIGIVHDP